MEYKDYYDVLGVTRTSEKAEIKKSYRKLARKYHPDVSKEADAETKFKDISEAYNVLKNKEKREAYDQLGANWQSGQDFHTPPGWGKTAGSNPGRGAYTQYSSAGGGASADYSDFFESLFGQSGGMGGGRDSGQYASYGEPNQAMQDQRARVQIDLADAYHGTTRELSLSDSKVNANGQVTTKPRTIKIKIPKGIAEGQTMRLKGQGVSDAAGSGARGDLFLEISFKPHKLFKVDGKNISLILPVTPWEAALGAQVQVPLPDGKRVSLTIPAGAEGGKKFRLKGKGIPAKQAGNLLVTLKIVTPDATSDEIKAAYEALRKSSKFDPRANLV